ncbi:AraC family transcriptional regulator [Sediminibacillus terrae]|uniref:AraC family transcriptional regulator n=1 Tax=Sediminibacillus terrae TaxID=1562106 RepID=UPI00192A60F5|nr:AraC family transcriptional regulator [Sediminibacillus terrae]
MINEQIVVDGDHPTRIPSLNIIRQSAAGEPIHTVYEPSICVIVQGAKMATLAGNRFPFDATSYLIASVHLPIIGQVIQAETERPFLCIQISFQLEEIINLLNTTPVQHPTKTAAPSGLVLNETTPQLLEAITRLVGLLDTPEDIEPLSPLVLREILYRVVKSKQGGHIVKFAKNGSNVNRIAETIQMIYRDFKEPLRVEELAEQVHMSTSSFHQHFKNVTAMTPLQYQKILRLQEARNLLLAETTAAADAGFQVGYESPTQFNREYARLFGLPPKTDVDRFQKSLEE